MDESTKEESGSSLTDRYKLPLDADADSKSWACLLDLNSPVELESDWYTTQTFQVFLDALDINQPASLGRDLTLTTTTTTTTTTATTTISNTSNEPRSQSNHSVANDKISPAKDKQTGGRGNSNFETILSAEALKILSELPDISHMSVTRSFMFPTSTNNVPPSSRTTTAGKR